MQIAAGVKTAKLFMSKGSQAVRLPTEFSFDVTEVSIRKHAGQVILEPIKRAESKWPKGFFRKIRITDRNFRRPPQPRLLHSEEEKG